MNTIWIYICIHVSHSKRKHGPNSPKNCVFRELKQFPIITCFNTKIQYKNHNRHIKIFLPISPTQTRLNLQFTSYITTKTISISCNVNVTLIKPEKNLQFTHFVVQTQHCFVFNSFFTFDIFFIDVVVIGLFNTSIEVYSFSYYHCCMY